MGSLNPDFHDETVIVTGGASGIGRAVARRFGDAGAAVLIGDLAPEPKDADVSTHDAIEDEGGTARFVETDVTDPDQLSSLIDAAREFGGVDVMVNNAGLHADVPFLETPPETLQKLFDVNVKGVFCGTQLAARDMIDRGDGGVIVNTASISSETAQFDQAAYDTTKGAVRMTTRSTALELAEHDVRVNAVAPGQIATEFVEGWSEEAPQAVAEDELYKPVPLNRAGYPEDLPGAYLFLASEEASYVTGELLYVDGGWRTV